MAVSLVDVGSDDWKSRTYFGVELEIVLDHAAEYEYTRKDVFDIFSFMERKWSIASHHSALYESSYITLLNSAYPAFGHGIRLLAAYAVMKNHEILWKRCQDNLVANDTVRLRAKFQTLARVNTSREWRRFISVPVVAESWGITVDEFGYEPLDVISEVWEASSGDILAKARPFIVDGMEDSAAILKFIESGIDFELAKSLMDTDSVPQSGNK